MKKFLLSLSVAVVAALCAVGAGCGNTDLPAAKPNGEWIEVQNIYYALSTSNSGSITSKCYIKVENELVSQEEYDNAPADRKDKTPYEYQQMSYTMDIPVNRKEFINQLNADLNNPYYENYGTSGYVKFTLRSYELRYVSVRFSDNNVIEINQYYNFGEDEKNTVTARILPIAYSAVYFND